jgi:hypothetical protein
MPDNNNPFRKFDPRAAILLNPKKFVLKITVDMTNGGMVMETEGADLNALAVLDLLTTQVQIILRGMLMDLNLAKPGIPPAGGSNNPGGNDGSTGGGNKAS